MAESRFTKDPNSAKWEAWVAKTCAHEAEQREVPCVMLETVLESWLHGRDVSFVKLDAQGFELEIVKSAGGHVDKLKKVQMELVCDNAAKLYVGQLNCSSTHAEMLKLGFTSGFDPASCRTCKTEMDGVFMRS